METITDNISLALKTNQWIDPSYPNARIPNLSVEVTVNVPADTTAVNTVGIAAIRLHSLVKCDAKFLVCQGATALAQVPLFDTQQPLPCPAEVVFCGPQGLATATIGATAACVPCDGSLLYCDAADGQLHQAPLLNLDEFDDDLALLVAGPTCIGKSSVPLCTENGCADGVLVRQPATGMTGPPWQLGWNVRDMVCASMQDPTGASGTIEFASPTFEYQCGNSFDSGLGIFTSSKTALYKVNAVVSVSGQGTVLEYRLQLRRNNVPVASSLALHMDTGATTGTFPMPIDWLGPVSAGATLNLFGVVLQGSSWIALDRSIVIQQL